MCVHTVGGDGCGKSLGLCRFVSDALSDLTFECIITTNPNDFCVLTRALERLLQINGIIPTINAESCSEQMMQMDDNHDGRVSRAEFLRSFLECMPNLINWMINTVGLQLDERSPSNQPCESEGTGSSA
jgi:hypothetical protein